MLQQWDRQEAFGRLSRFRGDFYDCLNGRGDALFELTDAVLCTDGPVKKSSHLGSSVVWCSC